MKPVVKPGGESGSVSKIAVKIYLAPDFVIASP